MCFKETIMFTITEKTRIYLKYINLDSLVTGPRASPVAQLVGLQAMGWQRVGHDLACVRVQAHAHTHAHTQQNLT